MLQASVTLHRSTLVGTQRNYLAEVTCHRLHMAACMEQKHRGKPNACFSSSVQIKFAREEPARATQPASCAARNSLRHFHGGNGLASLATVRPCWSDRVADLLVVISGPGYMKLGKWCRMARMQRQSCDLASGASCLSGLGMVGLSTWRG